MAGWVVRSIPLDDPQLMLDQAKADALDIAACCVYITGAGVPTLVAIFNDPARDAIAALAVEP